LPRRQYWSGAAQNDAIAVADAVISVYKPVPSVRLGILPHPVDRTSALNRAARLIANWAAPEAKLRKQKGLAMTSSLPLQFHQPDEDTMGGRLVRAREARGLTIGGVANQLGVKRETIAAWERDRSEPRINRLVMLAGILGVSPTWLMSGRGTGVNADDEQDGHAMPEALSDALREARRLLAETGRAIETLERQIRATRHA
jgi:HTH-type transcriptional regulator, cell division transcriptional repressor